LGTWGQLVHPLRPKVRDIWDTGDGNRKVPGSVKKKPVAPMELWIGLPQTR
jgi:hypothetical protein